MFQEIITILTATTFVAHGLFGCCWHHDHAHVVSGCGPAKQTTACQGHGHHRHSHGSGGHLAEGHRDANHDSQSPHPELCHEGNCVFARTQDGPSLSGDILMASAVLFSVALPCDCPLTANTGFSAIAAQCPAAQASAPLCALSQVWLI